MFSEIYGTSISFQKI